MYRFIPNNTLTRVSTCLLLALQAGCAMLPPLWSFERPPRVGATVPADQALVLCKTEAAAITMAQTGFYMPGCADINEANSLRVIAMEFRDLGNGQELWLATVALAGERGFIPIPWHNWA